MKKSFNSSAIGIALLLCSFGPAICGAQTPKKVVRIFLNLRETNLEKPSTVGINTLTERLAAAGFRVTTTKKEANLILDGTLIARAAAVTDEVKRQGGVNAEASASVRILAGTDVIASSVERTGNGDWGVVAERVGEDRLIEVAGQLADDLFSPDLIPELAGEAKSVASTPPKDASRTVTRSPSTPSKKPRKGVSFLEVAKLVESSAPEERIVAALKKHGIKFKPLDGALVQLKNLGASDSLISTVKSSNVVA